MTDIAAADPFSVAELTVYRDGARVWVMVEDSVLVGYALVDIVDGLAHLEQISVDPRHGRRGYGAALLAHVYEWAFDNGLAAVTLTTFEHVPWNAPYYARHGFRVLEDHELGPELRTLRAAEALQGLEPALRVCMRREIFGAE